MGYGIRLLLRNPGFTFVAVMTLATGIGANCLVFSVVDSVLLRPFPYPQPDRLTFVWGSDLTGRDRYMSSFPNFLAWKSQSTVFEGMGAEVAAAYDLAEGSYPERIKGRLASASLFTTLGMQAQIGRTFTASEEWSGSDHVVLLSDQLWRTRFHADPTVVGSTIRLNRNGTGAGTYTIVGVLPPSMRAAFPTHSELWSPVARDREPGNSNSGSMGVVARLKPGISMTQAQSALRAVAANPGQSVVLTDFQTHLTGGDRRSMLTLLGAVAFVLLIACANVANMMLARATDREREMTIRAAIGASRMRLFRQLLIESVVISLLGGLIGALLTRWSIELVKAAIPAGTVRAESIAVDLRVLAFTFCVSLLTGVIFGFFPALRASKVDINSALKGAGASGTRGSGRLRSLLVVAEVAVGLVLLTGAGLMINSFIRLLGVSPGFTPRDLLAIEMWLPRERYGNDRDRLRAMNQLLDRVRMLPGVRYAGITDFRPFSGTQYITARKAANPNARLHLTVETIVGDYFAAMGTNTVHGRLFAAGDDAGAPAVAVINDAAARLYWPGEEPLGKEIQTGQGKTRTTRLIVGIVTGVRRNSLEQPAEPGIYIPQAQASTNLVNLVIRTQPGISAASVARLVRSEMAAVDKELAAQRVDMMADVMAERLSRPRFLAGLLSAFGLLALMLTVTGVYGVVAYIVRLRTREIGIRMALGAEPGDVLLLIMKRGLILGAVGIGLGAAGSLALTRTLASMLYEVTPNDPVTLGAVAFGLAGIVLLATLVPARRATRVDPVIALRYE